MEDNRLKHRLIGATVLVALGVVFLPVWMDMRPGPGTRLEKTNIPTKPQWHFFSSEKEEHQAVTPPPTTTPNAAPNVGAGAVPPAAGASVTKPEASASSSPTVPGSVPQNQAAPSAQTAQPSPASAPPPARTSIYTTKIGNGASLYTVFAKANLGADQVRSLLRLGASTKNLSNIQAGRELWIKTGSERELVELIYYGPGHTIYTHVMRHGNRLQLADSASAVRVLTAQEPQTQTKSAAKTEPSVPQPPAREGSSVAKLPAHPAAVPLHPVAAPGHPAVLPVRPAAVPAQPVPAHPAVVSVRPAAAAPPVAASAPPHAGSARRANTATAWVVQIVSLKREENARALQDSLRSKGFPVYLESLYDGANKQWRVRVGPSTDHAEIDALRVRLNHEAHLPGQVLPYP